MTRKSVNRLNFILALVFLVGLGIILITVNPFEASIFQLILFYVVFFGFILNFLNFIGNRLRIPFWLILLISISIIFLLIFQSYRF